MIAFSQSGNFDPKVLDFGSGSWQAIDMAKKRTKADKLQRNVERLERPEEAGRESDSTNERSRALEGISRTKGKAEAA